MMFGIGTVTSEEEKAIEALQVRMKDALTPVLRKDPTLFYRFLKARDFDVDNAEKMLRKHITWRKIHQADTILQDFKPKEFFVKFIKPRVIGNDKDGDLVMYCDPGKLNIKEVFKCTTMNNYMKHWVWFPEKYASLLKEQSEKIGKCSFRSTLILDLEQLTFATATSKLATEVFLRYTQLYQDNYPERMKSIYIINAPSYYVFLFTVVKTVMSNATIKKIHIFGYNGWKEKLLEFVDADVLPMFLGGNRTDPDGDPMCRSFINFAGRIPEKHFLTDEERYFMDKTRVKSIKVQASKKKEVYVDVKEIGFKLQWEFLVKGKDIGFGVFFEVSETENEEIIPIHKIETLDGTERDSYRCQSAGRYIIVFHNSYSWLSSKEIEYCLNVLDPEQ